MAMPKQKSKKDMDMVNGPLWNKILIFALPIALTALMQQLFHSADMAVVGKFTGKNELAAVGSNGPIINLLVNIFMGFSAGSNVVIAQLLGAGKIKTANKAIHTSLFISVVSGIIVMILGITLSPSMLKLVSSPPEVIGLATLYLRIYFLGIPFTMIYNFAAAILRSRGETTKPFFCLLVAGILNIVLNIIFVVFLDLSVAGVAIATAISNIVSCAMVITILVKDKSELSVNLSEIRPDKFIVSKIFKIGLPMAIQSSLFPVSNLLVQSSINSLGTNVIAASAAASSIESYSYALVTGFDQAAVTFVSQNFGAKNIKRCKKSLAICLSFNLILVTVFNLIMYIFSDGIINMFTSDVTVAAITKERLYFMYLFFSTSVFMNAFTNTLRGLGYSFVPTLVSVAGICGFRVVWLLTVFKMFPTLYTILAVYPISWSIVSVVIIIIYFIIIRKFNKQKDLYIV